LAYRKDCVIIDDTYVKNLTFFDFDSDFDLDDAVQNMYGAVGISLESCWAHRKNNCLRGMEKKHV